MKPPVRIRDDRTAQPDLAADLEAYSRAAHPYDQAAGWKALERAIGESTSLQPASSKLDTLANAVPRALALKLTAAGLIAVGAAGWLAIANPFSRHEQPRSVPRAAPAVIATPPAAPPSIPPPMAEERPTTATPRETPVTQPQRAVDDAALRSRREIAQLGRIRELLSRDPRTAIRLAEAGHREFGAGMLYQEREALAILAMWSVGDVARADARSRVYLARFPSSAFRARIEAEQRAAGGVP